MGTLDLQPVNQEYRKPRLAIGIWSGGGGGAILWNQALNLWGPH